MRVKRHVLQQALRIAAVQFDHDEARCRLAMQADLADQFRRQSQEAYALAEHIEQATTIELEGLRRWA